MAGGLMISFMKKNNLLLLILILLLGASIRYFPNLPHLKNRPVPLSTPDSYYHMRRVLVTINNYPHLPTKDYYISYPEGGYCIWPPLYDFLAASLSYFITLGHPSVKQAEWICAVYPIIFSLLVIIFVFLISNHLFDTKTAILSSFFTAILPGTLNWSCLGYFDHHIAESMSVLLILYMLLTNEIPGIKAIIKIGISFGVALLFWQGGIFFIGVAFACIFFKRKFNLWPSFLIAALLISPFALFTNFVDSPFSYRGLSLLHVSMLGVAALIMLIGWFFSRRQWRMSIILSFLLLLIIYYLLKSPALAGGISFIFKKDPWLATILEFQPLMVRSGYIETITSGRVYGRAYYIWPLALLIISYEGGRFKLNEFFVFAVITGIMAFLGHRYSVWFTPFYAIILSKILLRIQSFLAVKLHNSLLKVSLMIIIVIVIFQPIINKSYLRATANIGPTNRDNQLGLWLRDSTQVTQYYLKPDSFPAYGVMCFWNDGHYLLYLGQRPVTASNFGNDVPNFKEVNEFYLSDSEEKAIATMNRFRCRYVVIRNGIFYLSYCVKYLNLPREEYIRSYQYTENKGFVSTISMPTHKGFQTTIAHLNYNFGSANVEFNIPAYRHFRMRYHALDGDDMIFELVPGAVLTGFTKPEQVIKINKQVKVGSFSFVYQDYSTANSNGLYKLIVPYPADSMTPYNLIIGDGEIKKMVVDNQHVMSGASLLVR